MGANLNTYGDISPRTEVKAAKKLLRVGLPKIVTAQFAQIDNQPSNTGKTRKWRRYLPLPLATSPMADGVTPTGHKMTYSDVTVVLQQFGDLVELTDQIADTHEDPVLQVYTSRLGEQFAQTIESVTIDKLKTGTNVFYTGTATTRATVSAQISRSDIRRIVRSLDRNNASTISEIISPAPKESTQGVEAGYFAMGHTDLEPDVRNITGFKTVVEYANPGQARSGEIGSVERVRFILTPMFTPWLAAGASGTTNLSNGDVPSVAAAADVYPLIIVARDAYATVRLQGQDSVKIMVLNPGVARGSDGLGQRGSIGWKTMFAAARLQEMWMAKLECPAKAIPN